jgi:hypothetical protein
MRKSLKEQRDKERLATLLGIAPPEPNSPTGETYDNISREAEAVIALIERPTRFTIRTCHQCKQDFAVNRANVAYCSDVCRAAQLEELGLTWDWNKPPESRWYYCAWTDKINTEPLVVQEVALNIIRDNDLLSGNNVNTNEDVKSLDAEESIEAFIDSL